MSDSQSDRNPLDVMAEEFVARFRRGERPPLTEFADRHPELADEIRDLFPALVMMEQAVPTGDPTRDAAGGPPAGGTGLERVGDFRILREVGRGGMGIVYEAEQESLGRRVALKLLPAQTLLDAKRLLRFQREARAAAKLHHTNIVPVFGVGEADGYHFYAMQFIRGLGLDQVLDELRAAPPTLPPAPPTRTYALSRDALAHSLVTGRFEPAPDPTPLPAGEPSAVHRPDAVALPVGRDPSAPSGSGWEYWRSVARIGAQVADALSYAHAQGVLHRDIKPANLLLDTHGTVWVTDFGLAKAVDSDDLTHTGDIIGTLRYMAPERFEGHGDQRADVYALGLTLYELITLRPAFASDVRAKLIQEVTEAAPPRPRVVNPAVPRDLETIVLKATARDPALRYQTAALLAEDLRRFLDDRPIRARRATASEQAWRWCRRNPAVASLLTAVLVLLTALSAVGIGFSLRLGAALEQSQKDQRQAEGDRDAAREARREGQEKLLQSLISEARASQVSRRPGQRFATLNAVRKAVALARELDAPPKTFDELRTLAVAALALPDIRPDVGWTTLQVDADRGWYLMQVDPTFRLAAVCSQKGEVSVRRVGTGPDDVGEVTRLPGLGSEIGVQWSPDGRHLAVLHWWTSHERLQVWRVTDGGRWVVAVDVPDGCRTFAFTPDGKQVIANRGVEFVVYDLATGERGRAFPSPSGSEKHSPGAGAISHHPLRPELAVAVGTSVVFVDTASGEVKGRVNAGGKVTLSVWHPHGELLAVLTDGLTVEIWEPARRKRLHTMEHRGGGVGLSFNRAGDLLVSSGWNGRVKLWNPHTGREVFETIGSATHFGPDDRLSLFFPDTAGDARPFSVVNAGRECRTLVAGAGSPLGGVRDYFNSTVHPNGRLLAVSAHEGFSLLDLATGTERAFVPLGCRPILFQPDGQLLTGLLGQPTRLYRWPVRADPGDPNRLLVGPPELVPVSARADVLARSQDGGVLAAADYDGATVWHPSRLREAVRLRPHDDCRDVAVSPDGALVATGSHSERGVKVWDAATGRLVRALCPERGLVSAVFSPDGRWLFNNFGQSWRTADWSEGPRHPGVNVTFTPDGRLSAWSGNGAITLTDPATGRELARLEDPYQDNVYNPTFTPDGATLVGTTNNSFCVRVWDLRKIREALQDLGLDWDAPPYPPAPAAPPDRPLAVTVLGADLPSDPGKMEQAERERALLAVWADPFDPDARVGLAASLLQAGKPADAIPHLTAAIIFRPDQTAAYRVRAAAHFQLRQWEQVVADATAVLARRPTDTPALDFRAEAHVRMGKHRDAVADLTNLIAEYPEDAELYELRAESYSALGERAKAEADRRTAVRVPATRSLTLNNQAWRLLTGPADTRDPKRALELIERAVKLAPNTPNYHNTLGLAQYRNGRHADAVKSLEKSLAGGKGAADAYDLYVLALCHHRLGDKGKAKDYYERAVKWHDDRRDQLDPQTAAELKEFRAEAATALGCR